MKLMLPAIIGLSATQINLFINTFFASSCPEGSVSWLNYAFRLIMFPIGVVGVSLSIATLPVVSVHASRGDTVQLRDAYVSSTVLSFLLTIPASVGLIFLATPIVRLIFEHGRFTAFDTMNTAQALALYSAGPFCLCIAENYRAGLLRAQQAPLPGDRLFYYRVFKFHLRCAYLENPRAPGNRPVDVNLGHRQLSIPERCPLP